MTNICHPTLMSRQFPLGHSGPMAITIWSRRRMVPAIASRRRTAPAGTVTDVRLLGIPILIKDNIDTTGMPTTAGSLALAGSTPPDAFTIARLKAAGALILGRTNLSESCPSPRSRTRPDRWLATSPMPPFSWVRSPGSTRPIHVACPAGTRDRRLPDVSEARGAEGCQARGVAGRATSGRARRPTPSW